VNVSGNDALTIDPGIYSQISGSLNGKLTLNPGVYVVLGGGFTAKDNAIINGTGVVIYNAGSDYNGVGNPLGAITLSDNAHLNLTAPTSGPYAGIALFQARDNAQPITLRGNAIEGLSGGILYAPAALVSLGDNAQLSQAPLIVNELQITGNGIESVSAVPSQVSGPSVGVVAQSLAFALTFGTDAYAYAQANPTFRIVWGDGTSQAVSPVTDTHATHTFYSGGHYTVQLQALDAQGVAHTLASLTVVVSDLAPILP
jgi:hypothetical protein